MSVSVFDMFKVGIGPSSSHTVGPMVAARRFVQRLADDGALPTVTRVRAQLYGSLSATGWGHGSENAVLLGFEGERPESVDTDAAPARARAIREEGRLALLADDTAHRHDIAFTATSDMVLQRRSLPFHPNGMTFTAWSGRTVIREHTAYSVGGGFVLDDDGSGSPAVPIDATVVPYPFQTADSLLAQSNAHELSIPQLVLANECARRSEAEVRAGVLGIWRVMKECIGNGCRHTGTLPGGLAVRRRAARMHAKLLSTGGRFHEEIDPLAAMDWVTLWALAVNEENAAGGRVVTAPTNGAAGVIPAVLLYVMRFMPEVNDNTVVDFLLTAGAIGAIFKTTASISGAEVGCQGEVGTACAMAAAGMTQILGGTAQQVTNAAEIGLEHHLGMTCDPVSGLVQIPCIERNAVAAIKAITAARLALTGDGYQHVSLDQCIRTMMETGLDMKSKYKETARGGLAVNIVEC